MRRTSSATLEFPEDTLVMLSFHFLFTRKPTPACPLLTSELPTMQVATLESCESFLFSSDFSEPSYVHFHVFSFSFSSSSSHKCSSLCNVLTLYVAIFSRTPQCGVFIIILVKCVLQVGLTLYSAMRNHTVLMPLYKILLLLFHVDYCAMNERSNSGPIYT